MVDDEPGTELIASFTPKQHSEFSGRPQTLVSRMKLED
jgi:hypothetical protein